MKSNLTEHFKIHLPGIPTWRRLPTPPLLRVAKTGKNHVKEEITPLLPTGIGKRFSQTISNLGHAPM
jgi:hypothetical protein